MDQHLLRIANAKIPVTLAVKVIPKSSRNEIVGVLADGTLRIKITAAPEKGKANEALCAFLAEELGIARSRVTVVRGHASTRKLVRIEMI